MKKSFIISIATILFFSGLLAHPAMASGTETCQPIYGGGTTCEQEGTLSVNLTVQNPKSKLYLDNLTRTDFTFTPGQTVTFEILVKNVDKKNAVNNITVKNIFPQYAEFAGKDNNYNAKERTLTVKVDKLNPNEGKAITVQAKVVGKDKLPKNQDIVCIIDQAVATTGNKQSQDNSQFCVQINQPKAAAVAPIKATPTPKAPQNTQQTTKGGLPVYPPTQTKTTPPTGPEALALVGLIPAAGLGFWLKKRAIIS